LKPGSGKKLTLILLGVAALAMVFHWVNPAESALIPPCPFKYVTGLNCPGCGSTRALFHLFHGEILDALAMNPLMVFSLPFLFWMLFDPPWTRKAWITWLIFSIFLCYSILRNLPFPPFEYLAPGALLEPPTPFPSEAPAEVSPVHAPN